MKTLTAATLVSLTLIASPFVMAQTQPAPSTPPPAASAPRATTTPGGATQLNWYSHQTGEMRASKLIGTAVKNQAGETVGDINDVVLSKEGQVAAVVIGVGGFLGIGEREVAVSFDSIRLTQDENRNTVVSLNATKDALKAAPQWEWVSDSRSGTTGTGANRPPVAK
jgi:sporulation protein YlmC with PRC-barrel domain